MNSASAYNNKKTTTKTAQPFCKVCYDAGKNESVYTSHFLKDKQGPEGKVVCPYLLSLTCSFCKKSEGHTARHCPILLKRNDYQHKQHQHNKEHNKKVEEKDGWATVTISKSHSHHQVSKPQVSKPQVSKPQASKYINTLAILMEQEEDRVVFSKKENKPSLTSSPARIAPALIAPALIALAPSKEEESYYGTYSITPMAISWGDEDQW